MTQDFPDYTDLMHIIGADIMVPIDIQGAYIMMPVDIQAQYVTLDINIKTQELESININIVAQSLENLNINIAAQDADIDVNITNATINVAGTLTVIVAGSAAINFTAQNVGIYLQPEWAVKEGTDKSIGGATVEVAAWDKAMYDYAVPGGKTLQLVHFGGYIFSDVEAEGDQFIRCQAFIEDLTSGEHFFLAGGESGFSIDSPRSITIPGGRTCRITIFNRSNKVCNVGAEAIGYEV